MKFLSKLILVSAMAWTSVVYAAPESSASKAELEVLEKQTQLKLDTQKELLQKDIQSKDERLNSYKERLDKQDARISDIGLYLTIFGALITLLVAGLVFLGFISVRGQVVKWFEENASQLKTRIKELEKDVAATQNIFKQEGERVITQGVATRLEMENSLKNSQQAFSAGGKTASTDKKIIEEKANELTNKPESQYTFEDWNTRAFAAVSDKNLALAVEYWSKAAGMTSSDAVQIAQALYNKGVALSQLNRSDDEIAVYDALITKFSDSKEAAVQEQVAKVIVNKGFILGQLNRYEDAIALYDVLIAKFSDSKEAALQEPVVKAMVNKGVALRQLNRSEDAIAVYDALTAKFGDSKEAAVQEQVAKAMMDKGITLGKLNRSEEQIAVYDALVVKFSDSKEACVQEQVAKTLMNKGVNLGQLNRSEDALSVYDALIAKFGDSKEAALQEQVAKAMVNSGATLEKLNRNEKAIAMYDALIAKFRDSKEALVQEPLARAMMNKGFMLGQLKLSEDAIAVYEALIAKFGDSKEAAVQELVALALNIKGGSTLVAAKKGWSDEVERIKQLLHASKLLAVAFEHNPNSAITIGNQAYVAWLQGNPEVAEEKFKAALTAPVNGGETIYKGTLPYLEMHPVDLDAGFKLLIERLWLEYSNSKAAD